VLTYTSDFIVYFDTELRDALSKIEELGMRKICAKTVSRNLTEQQQYERLNVCADLLQKLEAEPQLKNRVISGDESWSPPHMTQRPNVKVWNAKESTHVQVKSEIHACVLLRFLVYCSQTVGSFCTESQSVLLHTNSQ